MTDELCELINAGLSIHQITIMAVAIISGSIALFWLSRKGHARYRYLLFVFALGAALVTTSLPGTVFAQSAEDCQQSQAGGSGGGVGQIGGLIDDNPPVAYDEDYGEYRATFAVLPNDDEPVGDGFDVSTLRLVGANQLFNDVWSTHLILDPNDQTMPDPDSDWWNAPNVWGAWYLETVCDPEDTDNCAPFGPDAYHCTTGLGSCRPNGDVTVYFTAWAPQGSYSIQYAVNTQSGISLAPATITVNLILPSPITANNLNQDHGCGEWPVGDFSMDMMDGSFFSTTSSGTLLANSIDLDPSTPGRQDTVTIYENNNGGLYGTFHVDSSGILTVVAPHSVTMSSSYFVLSFTIDDTDGFVSNTGTLTLEPDCE